MPDVRQKLVRDALNVWAPNWPRRVTRRQAWVDNRDEATSYLQEAEGEGSNSPFVSVYSFPRGHTKEGNVPRVDTIFIDFDFEGGDYEAGSGDRDAWRRDLSHLLVRARMVARHLRDYGRPGWRASLSGHKGIHLFLDFPALEPPPGEFEEMVAGINDYATDLIDQIQEETGLDTLHRYVDVTSSDLGRLCRVPNTRHNGASESFGEDRFCVPVTIDELAELSVDEYESMTRSPRPMPYHDREPNTKVAEVLTQYIRTADLSVHSVKPSGSTVNRELVDEYREQSNDEIELEDVKLLTSDRPCVWRFHEREDKYRHGYESHYMELFVIRELIEKNVPIEVMKEFLSNAPEYDEDYTENRIEEIISRDYHRFGIESVLRKAPEFTGYEDCSLCQRVLADKPQLKT
jgi:hypothetical protein